MRASLSSDLARSHDGDAGGINPGRLWSLWDTMRQLHSDFFKAYNHTVGFQQVLGQQHKGSLTFESLAIMKR